MRLLKLILSIFIILNIFISPGKGEIIKKRIMVIMPVGNIYNSGFLKSSYEGIVKLRRDKELVVDMIQPANFYNFDKILKMSLTGNYDLIIGIGFPIAHDMKKIAKKFPNQRFAIIGSLIMEDNVSSYIFKDEEGAFLAGVIAATTTRTQKIGFIGGMKSTVINSFKNGFIDGATTINKKIKIDCKFVDKTPYGFSDTKKCSKITQNFIKNNIDVIYTASGESNFGALQECQKYKKYFIGVYSKNSELYKDTILASINKRVDNVLKMVVEDFKKGTSQGSITYIGISENGYDIFLTDYIKNIPVEKIKNRIKFYKKEIISGLDINNECE